MLRILHLEDDPLDAGLVVDLLRRGGLPAESERVDTLPAFREQLWRGGYGLILSDYTLPGVDAMEALALAKQLRPEIPFIFFSGTIREDDAIEALKQGASDYVLKQRLGRLVPCVRRALQEAEAAQAVRHGQEELARANTELERKVEERTAQLVQANSNLQAFAYTAAHDLRSPLRSIRSFSTMLAEDCAGKLNEHEQSLLGRVVKSAEQMQRLLNDLLEYSKMNQAALTVERVGLGAAVSEALELLEHDLSGKGANVHVGEHLPTVAGHYATVVLILNNLISNALKFVDAGVAPDIRVDAENSNESAGFVRVWVEDNGIGIAPEDWEKVFGAFERLHGKQAYPGTGLGLAIVRKGVERMGGRVGVESEPGKGSRFWVELRSAA